MWRAGHHQHVHRRHRVDVPEGHRRARSRCTISAGTSPATMPAEQAVGHASASHRPCAGGYRCSRSPGCDPAGLDEAVDVVLLQADHPPELIGRELPLVDEAVQAPQGDPQPRRGLLGAEPLDCARASGRFSHRSSSAGARSRIARPSSARPRVPARSAGAGSPRRPPPPSRPAARAGPAPPCAQPERPSPSGPTLPRARRPPRSSDAVGGRPRPAGPAPAPAGPVGAAQAASSASVRTGATSGSQTRRHCGGRLAGPPAAAARRARTRPLALPADHRTVGSQRHDAVDARARSASGPPTRGGPPWPGRRPR